MWQKNKLNKNLLRQGINNHLISNQRGIGLIAAMIAAAMVFTVALTVSYFVSDQNRQNKRLEIKGNCEVIANSIVEHIKKDENSLFISSYGPNPAAHRTQYPASLGTTDDGLNRFRFGAAAVSVFTPNANPLLNQSTNPPTLNWDYYNYLNIRNSSNRLTLLAANGFCCQSLNMDNCTNPFTSPGFTITEPNVEVFLGINLPNPAGGSLCAGGATLTAANAPNSTYSSPIDFRVRVRMNRGTSNERICEAAGRVQRKMDTDSSLTLIQYENSNCAAGGSGPSFCGSATSVRARIKTVKNNAGTNCQTSCLAQIRSRTCADITANGGLSLFNSFASCSAQCADSEPGSNFLCKIGTKSWFANSASANAWEPCESATVRNGAGGIIAGSSARIEYLGNASTGPQITTEARVTLSGLPQDGYVMDVRAVDTSGNVGRSFCSFSDSCDAASEPHFTIVTNPPNPGVLTEGSNFVKPMAANGAAPINHRGREYTLTNNASYTTALQPIANNSYQCTNGAPIFQVGSGAVGDTCVTTYTNPAGGTSSPTCSCAGGVCTTFLASLNARGNHQVRMTIRNACGSTTALNEPRANWCLDNNTSVGITTAALPDQGPVPNLSALINYPTTNTPAGTKACGVVSLCPNVNGTYTPGLRINNAGGTCGVPTGWTANPNSGCIRDPANNLCITVMDPCGRSQNTATAAPSAVGQYSSYLNVSATTTNECFSFGGQPRQGNYCAPGAAGGFCTITGKCQTTCSNAVCSNDEDCRNATYGSSYLDADGPKCVANRCTCPTNKESPARANCSQLYCPELNSCPINIGSTPAALGACNQCNHWVVGNWGACIAGNQTRSVTCPTGNCGLPNCFTQPVASRACPSCGTSAGGNFTTPPSTNLCAAGTSSAVTESGGRFRWNCTDIPSGSVVSCQANKIGGGGGCDYYVYAGVTVGGINSNDYEIHDCSALPRTGICSGVEARPICDGWGVPPNGQSSCRVGDCATCVNIPRQATCFVAGTQISLSNGKTKSIEDIKIGDVVKIYDEETGEVSTSPVTETLHHEAKKQMMYKFNFDNDESFTVTAEHLIFKVDEGYVPAVHLYSDFRNRKPILLLDDNENTVRVTNVTSYEDSVPTYNIHLKGISDDLEKYGRNGRGHNYFANGILAHNSKVCDGLPQQPPIRWPGTGRSCLSTDVIVFDAADICTDHVTDDAPYNGCRNDVNSCPAAPDVNGVCGPANGNSFTDSVDVNAAGLCTSGTASPASVSGSAPWNWSCDGSGAGTSVACSASSGVVNGTCGTADGTNQGSAPTGLAACATGTRINLSGDGPWTWTCDGSGTGHTDENCFSNGISICQAEILFPYDPPGGMACDHVPDAAACDVLLCTNSAHHGNMINPPVSGCTNIACYCNCPPTPVNGTCGSANGTTVGSQPSGLAACATGTINGMAGSGPWTWTCDGVNGGSPSPGCSANSAPVINGVCGPANGGSFVGSAGVNAAGLCTTGMASPASVTGTPPWSWTCDGSGTGHTDASCSAQGPCVGPKICLSCFVAGTQVTLANGKTKNIEDVEIGELVQTYDEFTGRSTVSPVEETFHHEEKMNELYKFTFSDGSDVTSNEVHLFYSVKDKNYFSAKDLYSRWMRDENILVLSDKNEILEVRNMEQSFESVKLYNLHVTGEFDNSSDPLRKRTGHNYYANGVLVHNLKNVDAMTCNQGGMQDTGGASCVGPVDPGNAQAACCQANGGIVMGTIPIGAWNCAVTCDDLVSCAGYNACLSGNGTCGSANGTSVTSAPTGTAACATGTLTGMAGSGPWTWTCDGTGTDANCSANRSCSVTAGTVRNWNGAVNGCTFTSGATTIAHGSTLPAVDSAPAPSGFANFQCTQGTLAAAPNAGATCNAAACSTWTGVFGSDNEDDGNGHIIYSFDGTINGSTFTMHCDSNGIGVPLETSNCTGSVNGVPRSGSWYVYLGYLNAVGVTTGDYDCSENWRCAMHSPVLTLRSTTGNYAPGDFVNTWAQPCSPDCDQFEYVHTACP